MSKSGLSLESSRCSNRLMVRSCGERGLLGSAWKVGGLDCWIGRASGTTASLSNHFLSFLSIFSSVRADALSGTVGVLRCKISNLSSLSVDDSSGVSDMLINELLVLDIDEGPKESYRSGKETESPEREPLDEPV
jgi:hypothetical protein